VEQSQSRLGPLVVLPWITAGPLGVDVASRSVVTIKLMQPLTRLHEAFKGSNYRIFGIIDPARLG
jgi:hypothetical protein